VVVLPPLSLAQANLAPELSTLYRDIDILLDDLSEFEEVSGSAGFEIKINRMQKAIGEIGDLRLSIKTFVDTPAENIISPIQETYTNLRGSPYPLVIFYAPSVLALLIQQLAITLASLGLVRERQMGAFEMFRVSPLRFSEILVGKSITYVLYVTIVGLILTGLLTLINVPFPFNLVEFLLLIVLTATASVGIGSLISAVARTDSQAVQFTMLILLLSIFFTGFFLPITGFQWPAWIIWALLPMSAAIQGFEDYLLVGSSTSPLVWIVLGIITLLAYGLVGLIMRRQYRKVLD
jgi:ABC-2 type transport system permease protein